MSGVPWLRREVIGGQTLYLGDCHEIMPQLRFDAIVSDPPYGIGYVQGEGHNASRIANLPGSAARSGRIVCFVTCGRGSRRHRKRVWHGCIRRKSQCPSWNGV